MEPMRNPYLTTMSSGPGVGISASLMRSCCFGLSNHAALFPAIGAASFGLCSQGILIKIIQCVHRKKDGRDIATLYTHHVEPPKSPPVALVSSITANQSSRAETTISYEAYTVMPCKTDTGQCRIDILIGMIDRENGFKIAGVDVKTKR